GPMGNTGVSVSHGQGPGFLGPRHEAFSVGRNPATGTYNFDTIDLPPGLDPARMRNRHEMLQAIDDAQGAFEASGATAGPGLQQVFSSRVRGAYDLSSESGDLRDRYGPNTFGQSCLLARRLIEHGVRLVTVNMFDTVFDNLTWDCHADGATLASDLGDYRDTL